MTNPKHSIFNQKPCLNIYTEDHTEACESVKEQLLKDRRQKQGNLPSRMMSRGSRGHIVQIKMGNHITGSQTEQMNKHKCGHINQNTQAHTTQF